MIPVLLACVTATALSGAAPEVLIEVYDALGGAIRGATVEMTAGTGQVTTTTDERGQAIIPVPSSTDVTLAVSAEGFSPVRRLHVLPPEPGGALRIVLEPAPLDTSVTVTATRSERAGADQAPSTSVLRSAELATAPGLTLDDALRHTPGFSLFRRSSSRVANPTTQGVTLRGLGASGASRTLVLAEGVPLNDAFGGWVSWNRIPLAAIDRVEVVRGSASDLYGPDALGGVIQLFTITPQQGFVRAYADAAGQRTARGSFAGGGPVGGWQTLAAVESATTDGYVLVAPEDRGPIDEEAGGSHVAGLIRTSGAPAGWLVQAGGRVFEEDRQNGTPFQRNATAARSAHAEIGYGLAGGYWRFRAFGGTQGFDQTFSAVNAARTTEVPTLAQRVPSTAYGLATDWAGGNRVRTLAGVEQRYVRAVNQETRFVGGQPGATTEAGGEQNFLGAFGQVSFDAGQRLSALLGARVERWTIDSFQDEAIDASTMFAPRASLAWRPRSDLVVRGAVSRSFRAPTLNERYRGFRVGSTVTNPNARLEPERLTALEVGASLTRGRSTVRATAFLNHLSDAIANVTVSTSPSLTVRQRRNAGSIDARGVEIEGAMSLLSRLTGSVSATFVNSEFADDSPEGLSGKRTPQSPKYQLAAELRWDDLPAVSVAARLLLTGPQYENDLNTLVLRQATILDLMASHSFSRAILAFMAVDNVFDQDYDVGRTPLRTIGSPRLFRAGLRMTLP